MNLVVNAWLEKKDPELQVIDQETGREILHWGPDNIRGMLEQGIISMNDLLDRNLSAEERLDLYRECCTLIQTKSRSRKHSSDSQNRRSQSSLQLLNTGACYVRTS